MSHLLGRIIVSCCRNGEYRQGWFAVRAIQASSGEEVKTLMVQANRLVFSTWTRNYPVLVEALTEGIKRTTPVNRECVTAG